MLGALVGARCSASSLGLHVELFMVIGKIFLCVFLLPARKQKRSAQTPLERDTLGPLVVRRLEPRVAHGDNAVSVFEEGATFRP